MATQPEPPIYTWDILSLEREVSDGYVHTAHWAVKATAGSNSASAYGSVGLERPAGDLIPYDQLTKSLVLEWAKARLGEDAVQRTEEMLAADIAKQEAPTEASGLPW